MTIQRQKPHIQIRRFSENLFQTRGTTNPGLVGLSAKINARVRKSLPPEFEGLLDSRHHPNRINTRGVGA